MKKELLVVALLIACVSAGLGGLVGAYVYESQHQEVQLSEEEAKQQRIADYYASEVAVGISPHTLRKTMDQGGAGFVLVDLRSAYEYEQEHITGAVSIPAVNITNTITFADQFEALPKDKVIVTYCYSSACMLSRQVGALLAEKGIYTKHLNIGWNEWRYDWKMWNAPSEWETTSPEQYVTSGKDPGTPLVRENASSCSAGELGC
jgi:rhodanese-related sulfurtransferase